MVKILLGNAYSKIVGHLPDHVQQQIDYILSYKVLGAQFSKAYKEKRWDGRARLYQKHKGQSFYSGLTSLVIDVLKQNGIPFRYQDRRIIPDQNLPHLEFINPSGFQNREYQNFAIEESLRKTRGILKIATGGGKTLTVCQLISEIKTSPFMFYVLSRDLLDQAYDALSSTLNTPIGRIGAGYFDIQDINVATIQSVVRSIRDDKKFKVSDYMFDSEEEWDDIDILSYEKKEAVRRLLANTKGFYLDEMHHASCALVKDVISASPNAYWRFGGTATPWREDNAEIVLQGLFGKRIVDISASYLIKEGYLLTPYIYFDPIHHENVPNAFQSVYSHCITKNDAFHDHVAKTANHLINNDLSTLVLVQRYAHGEALKKRIPNTPFVTGKMSKKKRREIINDLRNKNIKCMIATTLADEGLDVPTLDAALLAGGGASANRIYQRVGRTLRPDWKSDNPRDKSVVVVYDHKAKHLDKQTRKTRKMLKAEEEFKLIKSKGGDKIIDEISKTMDL